MDYKGIEQIIKTMSNSDVTSLEIETKDIKIAMKKGEAKEHIAENKEKVHIEDNSLPIEVQQDSLKETVVEKVKETKADQEKLITVTSPIVGTFYGAPSPDDEPFVKVGSKVKKGDTLCIIEAMKLMNEIDAEDSFKIVEILVKNEDMVEYGEPLFKVRA